MSKLTPEREVEIRRVMATEDADEYPTLSGHIVTLLAELDRIRPVYEAATHWRQVERGDPHASQPSSDEHVRALEAAVDKAEGRTG